MQQQESRLNRAFMVMSAQISQGVQSRLDLRLKVVE